MAFKPNLKRNVNTLDGFVLKKNKCDVSSNIVISNSDSFSENTSFCVGVSDSPASASQNVLPSDATATASSDCSVSQLNTSVFDICELVTEKSTTNNIDNNVKYKLLTKDDSKDLLDYKFPVQKDKNHIRSFQLSWLEKYKWAVYSKKQDGVYCKYCVLFGKGTSHNSVFNTLNTQPRTKWKKALELFSKHDISQYHKNSVLDSECFLKIYKNKAKSVQEMADTVKARRVAENRNKLISIAKTIILHGRENIPLRGHREDNCWGALSDDNQTGQGTFRALLKFRVDAGDVVLKEHIDKCAKHAVYISPRIQNELIGICGDIILEKIIAEIKQSPYFTVLTDETCDIAGIEQLSLCVRYLRHEQIVENFLTFVPVTSTTGEDLASVILTNLEKFGLDLNKLRGQGYDGASNMAGIFKGVQARITDKYPLVTYTHCCNHALNLVIVTSTNSSSATQPIKNMIGVVKSVTNFIRDNTVRRDIFKKYLAKDPQNESSKSVLKQLCETRWSERHSALIDFIKFFTSIVDCLQEINELKPESNAFSLLHAILNFEFILCLSVCAGISGQMLSLSKYLQKENRDLLQAKKHIDILQCSLKEKRSNADSSFASVYREAVELAEKHDVEVKTPRACKRQTQRGNISMGTDIQYYFKVNVFIPFLDHCISQISERFGKKFQLISELECFVPSFLIGLKENTKAVDEALSTLPYPEIDKVQLMLEMELWKIKWEKEKKETGVIPTCPLHTLPLCNGDLFPNIRKVLEILCVLPVTVAEVERSFSTLRRLKTWLRSTTSETRLNGLAALNVHKEINITAEEVIERFSNTKQRRLDLVF